MKKICKFFLVVSFFSLFLIPEEVDWWFVLDYFIRLGLFALLANICFSKKKSNV